MPISSDHDRSHEVADAERTAIDVERARLARELHDGVLQSLAGAALQLAALRQDIGKDSRAASQRLNDIEEAVFEEQRELRAWIHDLTRELPADVLSGALLAADLRSLCDRMERQWELEVRLSVGDCGSIPRALCDDVHHLVQEGLCNAARHARARVVRVAVIILREWVLIDVADDGRGFRYRGRYDLGALRALRWGPASIEERVAALGGELVLNSTPVGSRLQIRLPLRAKRAAAGSVGRERQHC
jgi:signal transduction histidine kinase